MLLIARPLVTVVADDLVEVAGGLGVPPCEHEAALPVGHERGLQVDLRPAPLVSEGVDELEGTLDVLAGSLVVALPAVAARAPLVDVRAQPVVRLVGLVEQLERPGKLGVRGRHRRERVAADRCQVRDLGFLLGRRARRPAEPASREELCCLGDAPGPDQRPCLAAHRPAVGRARRARRQRLPQLPEELGSLGVAAGVEQGLTLREALLDALQVGGAEARLEVEALDAEPLGEPVEQLTRRHDLAALDLAHVLLREAARGELDLRHSGGASCLADTPRDPRCRLTLCCLVHRDPTVRSFPKECQDVRSQYGPEPGRFPSRVVCWWRGGGGGIRTHGRVAPSAVFKTARFDRSRTPPRVVSLGALVSR